MTCESNGACYALWISPVPKIHCLPFWALFCAPWGWEQAEPPKGIPQCPLWISLLALAKGTARTWVRQAKPLKETVTLMCDPAQLSLNVSPGLPNQETGAGHSLPLPPDLGLQPCQVTGYQQRPSRTSALLDSPALPALDMEMVSHCYWSLEAPASFDGSFNWTIWVRSCFLQGLWLSQ